MTHIILLIWKIISESINTRWCQWNQASWFLAAPPTKIKLVCLNSNMANGICSGTITLFEGKFNWVADICDQKRDMNHCNLGTIWYIFNPKVLKNSIKEATQPSTTKESIWLLAGSVAGKLIYISDSLFIKINIKLIRKIRIILKTQIRITDQSLNQPIFTIFNFDT